MNTPDGRESNHIKPTDNHVPNPAYPTPPGGSIPDLNLAQWPNQQGASIQPMPDPGKPEPKSYVLSGDPANGGVDPANPVPPAPNLAGVGGWPPDASALVPAGTMFPGVGGWPIAPQYVSPDFGQPVLQTANLAADGISFEPRNEFDPDPGYPDLQEYNRPYGLTIHNVTGRAADIWKPDPVLGDLTQPELPDGIVPVRRNLDQPDPLLPDLQNPQMDQQVHMLDRPGDLDPHALDIMNVDPTAQSASTVPYAQSFIDASGMNNARRRHFDLLVNGLNAEEQ